MGVVIGSARISENNTVKGVAGDQKQTAAPDFKGEVSMQDFYVHKLGWGVLRPKSAVHANQIALNMYDLCNNKNAGYSQDDRYGVIRVGVHGATPFNCDCGTGVRACFREATKVDPGDFYTGNAIERLLATGLVDYIPYTKGMVLYTGDILCTLVRGHIVIVVTGANRPIAGGDTGNQLYSTHPNPYPEPTKSVRKGMKDQKLEEGTETTEVKWVQYELEQAGYDLSKHGGIDGDFGSFTESCVKAFQREHHLTQDGIVGQYTRTAFKRDDPEEKLTNDQPAVPAITTSTTTASHQKQFGIDVAKWQGVIDWAKVKADGQQFAVLKVTQKNNKVEDSFERNYQGARSAGIPIAVYRYVYAKTVGEAMKEADGIVAALSGKIIDGEVWLDMEDVSIRDIGKANLTKIINTEAAVLKGAGYKVGIYCNRDWYEKVIDGAGLSKNYLMWIAKYGKNTGNGSWKNRTDDPKDIAYAWQFTSKGKVSGISGNVDLNLIY